MTSNVLPLLFPPSKASSSQNSNVDDTLEGYKIQSALPYKIFSTLRLQNYASDMPILKYDPFIIVALKGIKGCVFESVVTNNFMKLSNYRFPNLHLIQTNWLW